MGTREIEEAVNAAGGEINKSEINLPDGVIRQIGEYSVDVLLHSDVTETIAVAVVAE